jgi:photosystem II stability/assembly factor-like uncharacterized protein
MLQPFIPRLYPLLLASVCTFSLTQCHKTYTNPAPPVPLVQPPKSMQVIEGNNLVGGINLNLPDTILVRIIPNDPSDAEKYFFNCSASDSVGNLQVMNLEIDSGGVNATLSRQTGRQSPRQDIKFYLLSNCTTKGCQVLDSVTISAVIKPPWTNVYSGSGSLTDIRFTSNQTALAIGQFSNGIVRTDDGGASWSATSAFRNDLEQLCFLDSLNGFVTVANDYAYSTTDGGQTFNQGAWTPPIIGDGSSRDFSMVSPNTIYSVGVQGTIVKSVDGGQDWQSLNISLNNHLYSICFLNKDIGFAGGQGGALIRTMDGGSTWSFVRTSMHFTIFSIRFFDMQHGVVVSETGEIADTNDGGITWRKECPSNNGVFSLQKAAIKDQKTVFAIQNGSIFRYDITP